MGFKVSIVGAAGTVGAEVGFLVGLEGFADEIVYIDILEDKAIGQAHDTSHGISYDSHTDVYQGEYEDAEDSDVVVITAGKPREPGMSRLDLAEENKPIMEDISDQIEQYCPDAISIITTNPMDVMNYHLYKFGDRPREKVLGFGGRLDTARFRYVLAERFNTSPINIDATILGEHGDSQVPVFSKVKVDGESPSFNEDQREQINQELQESAMNVIEKKEATQFGPARGVTHTIKSIAQNKGELIPTSIVLDGKYGHEDVSVGVPAKIHEDGAEIIEWNLKEHEKEKFNQSAEKLYNAQH